jgi:hypothetical protein
MSSEFETRLLLNTVIETDSRLSQWAERLASERDLELGDDPKLVSAIEHDLRALAKRVRWLGPQFDLSRVPLSKANTYFATVRQLDSAVSLVEKIRDSSFGSRQNTRKCLAQIAQCAESVRQIGNLLAPVSSVKN